MHSSPSTVPAPPHSTWDQRYLRLARRVALWSKDPSTQCGAILVRPDRTLASLGFNGFPRGASDDPALYADRSLKYPRVIHSEWNSAACSHDPSLAGYTVYAWPMPPCNRCTASLLQRDVGRVVRPRPEADKLERWATQFHYADHMWRQRQIEPEDLALMADDLPEPLWSPDVSRWTQRFLGLAQEFASWSKDPIAPRGAILVRPDKTVASAGFSGFPRGVDDTPLQTGDREAREAMLLPAEFNALLFSRDPSLEGATLYAWPCAPDLTTVAHLLHEGVRHLVFPATGEDTGFSPEAQAMWESVGGTWEAARLTWPS